ncbi:MAG: hypothetical protein ABSA14_11710 [Acidimicrobiales bacterium]
MHSPNLVWNSRPRKGRQLLGIEGPLGGDSGGRVDEIGAANAVELISSGRVQLEVNTPRGRGSRADGVRIRSSALLHQVPCLTTVAAARAAAGVADWKRHGMSVLSLQEVHEEAGGDPVAGGALQSR